ncbi:MAG: ATP-dependent DNA helicase [Chloroflexi bacterium]|nr:ATP-dependent DNA helicase [Chloroflexota bacterium]
MDAIYGPDGLLVEAGWEHRAGQQAMASAISAALADRRHLVVEAGTGVGKSLAYLIPAVLARRADPDCGPIVISTATKVLQDQLFFKDVPAVQQLLAPFGITFDAIVAKGLGNYACKLKLDETTGSLLPPEGLAGMMEWLGETTTGDVDELRFTLSAELRERTIATDTDCIRRSCRFYRDRSCWYFAMREQLKEADVVICNHALLCLSTLAEILPQHAFLVIDEAHQLENFAYAAFTDTLTPRSISRLIPDESGLEGLRDALQRGVATTWEQFTALLLQKGRGEWGSRQVAVPETQEFTAGPVTNALNRYYQFLKERLPQMPSEEEEAKVQKRIDQVESVVNRIERFCAPTLQGELRYVEEGRNSIQLHRTPIDVSEHLSRVVQRTQATVYTSATLAVGGSMKFFASRVGAGASPADAGGSDYREAVCESPFIFEEQALIWAPRPRELSEPPSRWEGDAARAYLAALVDRLERLVVASQGRAFLLFTSYRALEHCYQEISRRVGDDLLCLRQGEMPRRELLRVFQEDGNAILCATKSFWQGVDVPGEALSVVAIDRLPFSAPSPLSQARLDAVTQAGGNWFRDLMLPEAIIDLKQGFGRLIRSPADSGVMVLLDARIHTKFYGKTILNSLPPARRAGEFADVEQFFR